MFESQSQVRIDFVDRTIKEHAKRTGDNSATGGRLSREELHLLRLIYRESEILGLIIDSGADGGEVEIRAESDGELHQSETTLHIDKAARIEAENLNHRGKNWVKSRISDKFNKKNRIFR